MFSDGKAPGNRRLSQRKRLTYAGVARMAGVRREAIFNARRRGCFSPELADRVLFALNVDVRDILREERTTKSAQVIEEPETPPAIRVSEV